MNPRPAPTSSHLRRLLTRATKPEHSDVLAALGAVRELRAALVDLEAHHLRAARSQGVSWAEIGRALDITRAGARKRALDLDALLPEPDHDG